MERSFDALPRLDAEREKERIVSDNLRLMNGAMLRELGGESLGGNAGSEVIDGTEYPCAGCNLLVDRMTGRILGFGGHLIPKAGEAPIIFRFAVDLKREQPFFRLIRAYQGQRSNTLSVGAHPDDLMDAHAVDVLQRSIDEWNALQEIDITET